MQEVVRDKTAVLLEACKMARDAIAKASVNFVVIWSGARPNVTMWEHLDDVIAEVEGEDTNGND